MQIDSSNLKEEIQKDFSDLSKFSNQIVPLTSAKGPIKKDFEGLYSLTFLIYNFPGHIAHQFYNYKIFNEKHYIRSISYLQRDLVNAIYSINLRQFNVAKVIYRSVIETVFRISLMIMHQEIYLNDLSKGIYKATPIQRELRSNIDTHKIGRLTHFTVSFFSTSPISQIVIQLNQKYSDFSEITHTNDFESKTVLTVLNTITNVNESKIFDDLGEYNILLEDCFSVLYYAAIRLTKGEVISRDAYALLTKNSSVEFRKILKALSEQAHNLQE